MGFGVVRGDELDAFVATLWDGARRDANLTNLNEWDSVALFFYAADGTVVLNPTSTISAPATGFSFAAGKVESQITYTWQAGDTELLTANPTRARIVLTDGAGREKTYPRDSFITFPVYDRAP